MFIPIEIANDDRISVTAKYVYGIILDMCGEERQVTARQEDIARLSGVSISSICHHIRELATLGLITVSKSKHRAMASTYKIKSKVTLSEHVVLPGGKTIQGKTTIENSSATWSPDRKSDWKSILREHHLTQPTTSSANGYVSVVTVSKFKVSKP